MNELIKYGKVNWKYIKWVKIKWADLNFNAKIKTDFLSIFVVSITYIFI